MNNVKISHYMTYFPSKNKKYKGGSTIKNIDTVGEIKKSICSKGYCIEMGDIIKIVKGSENVSNIKNLVIDSCRTLKKLPFIDSPLPPDPNKPPQRHFMG